MLKLVRVVFWVVVILTVVMQLWDEYQALQWRKPLHVVLYPVNAEGDQSVADYMTTLREEDFKGIQQYFTQEAMRYQLPLLRPITLHLGSVVKDVPPAPPATDGGLPDIILWSLKFRWFSWWHQPKAGVPGDIKLYLLYYDAEKHHRLLHSTALQKGRLGRVNLFAESRQHAGNTIVIAHELLHTLSASDKYDLRSGTPIFPQGYAEPYQAVTYPQHKAEIMAGRIPVSETRSRMAKNLDETMIGRPTAREIGWSK